MTSVSIGFDRALKGEWLDLAATLAEAGLTADEARIEMLRRLADEFSGPEALAKAVLVLQRVWFPEDPLRQPLRNDAVQLIRIVNDDERLAIYWALLIDTYPFFRDCVEMIGRLLRLQPSFTGVQLQRRLVDSWGDRGIIDRARQHVLQTMAFWGVLNMVSKRGVYERGEVLRVDDINAARLVVQALVRTSQSEITIDDIFRSTVLFPFNLIPDAGSILRHERFKIENSAGSRRVVSVRPSYAETSASSEVRPLA